MSQEDSNNIPPTIPPETQRQRWLKYGGNVVIVSLIVIALAVVMVYASERKGIRRFDTTAAGLYSLKPQTLHVLKENKQKITIISLYTTAKQTQGGVNETADEANGVSPIDKPAAVSDLLDEYRNASSNISIEVIDPQKNPGKRDDLIKDVMKNYGGEVDKYKGFTSSLQGRYDEIIKLCGEESDRVAATLNQFQSQGGEIDIRLYLQFSGAFNTMGDERDLLKDNEATDFQDRLSLKVPDYKSAVEKSTERMQTLSRKMTQLIQLYGESKDNKAIPKVLRDYMASAIPHCVEVKTKADDLIAAGKNLGDLKLDTLRDALQKENSILVRGETEWRLIPFEKVWKTDIRSQTSGKARPVFSGEQMITTAILSLDQKTKPKVCFVRNGGGPLTGPRQTFGSIAGRLRDYNFEVQEKDLSGTYAEQYMQQMQQMQMQGQMMPPLPPEPTDAEIEDSTWVVLDLPSQMSTPSMAEKIADHLKNGHHYTDGNKVAGGSAFVMVIKGGDSSNPMITLDDLKPALDPWGITLRTDAIAVHKKIPYEGAPPNNLMQRAPHMPEVFTITEWGDHPITAPMQSLMGLLLAAVPVEVKPADGVTASSLMPVPGAPNNPECWGEVDLSTIEPGPDAPDSSGPKFHTGDKDPKKNDIAPPLFAAAAAEKSGARLVCTGSGISLIGAAGETEAGPVDMPDEELMEKKRIYAPQFPGSAEFFMNSCFWLSHQEPMIAISPAAMNVSRIREIKPGLLKFWHIGVLLIGLPGLVVIAGAMTYYTRQS
jgi:hypothetical protein